MNKITDFITNNLTSVLIGVLCLGAYFYFALAGNRICDCETTEKYSSAATRGARNSFSRTHFYHK